MWSTQLGTTLPRALPGPPFPLDMASIWPFQGTVMCISNCVLIKVSFLLNTLLGPGGRGLLPLLPRVRLHKDRATLRPVSPQGKSKTEIGPFWTRAVSDSGSVAGSPWDSPSLMTQNGKWFQRQGHCDIDPCQLLSWADRTVLPRAPRLHFYVNPDYITLSRMSPGQFSSFLPLFPQRTRLKNSLKNYNIKTLLHQIQSCSGSEDLVKYGGIKTTQHHALNMQQL